MNEGSLKRAAFFNYGFSSRFRERSVIFVV